MAKKTKSETKEAFKKTTIAGQALIEGLMMIGPKRIAMAIRKSDGSIYVEEIPKGNRASRLEKIPFIRGTLRIYRQLVTGTGVMMKSAEMAEEPPLFEDQKAGDETHLLPENEKKKINKKKGPSRLDRFAERHVNVFITIAAIMGILFSVALFIILPRLIVDFLVFLLPLMEAETGRMHLILNLVEGVIRLIILISYIILTSKIKDIARVWAYHGAEHKTIACYEAGEALTLDNIRAHSRLHPRCGTAFLFVVVIVAILIFSVVGALIGINIWWVNVLIRLALVPVIAGISFEVIRLAGKFEKNVLCRLLSKPGLWLQKFTTKEPDDSMIEVAIAAMEAVIPEHEEDDRW